jgi:hypothetical protein
MVGVGKLIYGMKMFLKLRAFYFIKHAIVMKRGVSLGDLARPFKVLGYYRCNFGFLMFMKNSSFWIPDVKPMCSS